jgi:tetratricopeptide (TPR) repeat protein
VRALDCFLRSERIARDIGDPLWTSIAVGNSGNAHLLGGDYARAMACYQQQLRVAQELGDRYGISLAVGNMGNIYEYQGENGAARACYLHALQLALELGDQPGVVIVLWSLATLSLADEVYAESQRLVDQAITLARALDLHYDLCACLYTRALILTRIDGDLDEASRLAVQARELAVHTDHSDIALRAELLEVRLAVKQQRISMAQGIERLEALFDQWELADEQAAIRYTIWRLDNRQRVHGFEAARQYRALYAETPRHEYRECYAELTGAALPPAPTLPPLPITITRDAINLTTLDEAVTNLIYARDLAL